MTLDFIIRILIASLLGGIIGMEREYRAKEAGFRTHFLVALGSALFMILSQYGFENILFQLPKASFDPSRIASQVVTGIGFIGAGTIIFQKHVVRGLTTAAGLWVTSAIGLTCGSGMYVLAFTATLSVLICLEALNYTINKLGTRNLSLSFSSSSREGIKKMVEKMKTDGIDIESYAMQEQHLSGGLYYHVTMEIRIKRNKYQSHISDFMQEFDGVSIESIE